MKRISGLGVAVTLAMALAACETYQPTERPLLPVLRLAALADEASAREAAAKLDRPLLILGGGVYGLADACIPKRYFADAAEGRLTGAGQDGRLTGAGEDGRFAGAAADERLGGAAADERLAGAAADERLGGAVADERLGGGAADQRLTGAAEDERLGGSAEAMRAFGAAESGLACRLAPDLSTIEIHGAGGAVGVLYSPRSGGALSGVLFY